MKQVKVLQSEKYTYRFNFSFLFSIPKRDFPLTSRYSTSNRLFLSQKGFQTVDRSEKCATLVVIANDIDHTISPYEYAEVIFCMMGDFLLKNYKKFNKESLDRLQLTGRTIESFPFPASFDEQQYHLDNMKYPMAQIEFGYDWAGLENMVLTHPREEYLKHFPF